MKVMVLWGRPSLTAGKLRGLWFLTLAPTGTVSPPCSSSFSLLLGRWHLFPGDTLSQSVGGGRGKGPCGEQGRWVWVWGVGESHSLCTSLLLQFLP